MSGMAPAYKSHEQAVLACASVAEDMAIRFRSPSPDGLVWRRWEDGSVVFHTPSCDTLFLDPASALLLEVLADGRPHTAGSLCAAAAARLSLPVPDADAEALETRARTLLDRLDRLGLLDRGMP